MFDRTIRDLSEKRMEKNKNKKLVKDLGGKEYVLAGVNNDAKKIRLYMGVTNKTAHFEDRNYRGHLFFCQICEKWRNMKKLWANNYPQNVVCDDCIDFYTWEESDQEMEEARMHGIL